MRLLKSVVCVSAGLLTAASGFADSFGGSGPPTRPCDSFNGGETSINKTRCELATGQSLIIDTFRKGRCPTRVKRLEVAGQDLMDLYGSSRNQQLQENRLETGGDPTRKFSFFIQGPGENFIARVEKAVAEYEVSKNFNVIGYVSFEGFPRTPIKNCQTQSQSN